MLVVSNTSPLSNLAIVNQLDLLRLRYGRVIVPERVILELAALTHAAGKQRINQAISDGWLTMQSLPNPTLSTQFEQRVDPGEAEAIALAELLPADKLIIDDRIGRGREHGVSLLHVSRH